MRKIYIGTAISIIGTMFTWLFLAFEQLIIVQLVIASFFLAIAALLSGIFVTGPQMRANFAQEDADERNKRQQHIQNNVLLATPSIIFIIALIVFM